MDILQDFIKALSKEEFKIGKDEQNMIIKEDIRKNQIKQTLTKFKHFILDFTDGLIRSHPPIGY